MRLYTQRTFNVTESFFRRTYRAALMHFVLFMAFLVFYQKQYCTKCFPDKLCINVSLLCYQQVCYGIYTAVSAKNNKRGKKIAILGYNSTAERLQHIFKKRKVITFLKAFSMMIFPSLYHLAKLIL
jgi:FlaA1/EpsC-like NDP-sugar epimerase